MLHVLSCVFCVTCHVYCVRCHMSNIFIKFFINLFYYNKVMELVDGWSLISRATLSSFNLLLSYIAKFNYLFLTIGPVFGKWNILLTLALIWASKIIIYWPLKFVKLKSFWFPFNIFKHEYKKDKSTTQNWRFVQQPYVVPLI